MGLNFPEFARNRFREILKVTNYSAAFNTNLTRRVYTRTPDEAGRLTNVTTADTTIDGFINYVTPADKQLIEQGWVQSGDATLIVEHDTDINIEDGIIDQDDIEWEVTKLVDAPKMQGVTIHKRYSLKRRD